MSRTQRVYRLDVTYPEGHPGPYDDLGGWHPEGWESRHGGGEYEEVEVFAWPAPRRYLSERGARRRADLLRGWGCTVEIVPSEPVCWPTDKPAGGAA